MRKFTVLASLLLVLGLAMPTALAASPTRVSVGGDITPGTVAVEGFSDGGTYFETDWQTPLNCDMAEVTGTIERGTSVVADAVIGEVTDVMFGDCTMFLTMYPFVMSSDPGSWDIVATETPASAGDPLAIEIRGVSAYLHSMGSPPWPCELGLVSDAITGTFYPGTTANGNDGRIETSTSSFSLAITAYNGLGTKTVNPPTVGGCAGQIYTGDSADMFGNFEMNVDPGSPGMNPVSHE